MQCMVFSSTEQFICAKTYHDYMSILFRNAVHQAVSAEDILRADEPFERSMRGFVDADFAGDRNIFTVSYGCLQSEFRRNAEIQPGGPSYMQVVRDSLKRARAYMDEIRALSDRLGVAAAAPAPGSDDDIDDDDSDLDRPPRQGDRVQRDALQHAFLHDMYRLTLEGHTDIAYAMLSHETIVVMNQNNRHFIRGMRDDSGNPKRGFEGLVHMVKDAVYRLTNVGIAWCKRNLTEAMAPTAALSSLANKRADAQAAIEPTRLGEPYANHTVKVLVVRCLSRSSVVGTPAT